MTAFVMTPRLRIRRRRSSSRHGKLRTAREPIGLASLLTTFLFAVVLIVGPLILGAARLWIELPLLGVVALLLLVQGLRLTRNPPLGIVRWADAIDLAVVLFVLYAIVRWLTSPAAYFSRIEAMEVVAYAGVFFTCRYGMANRKHCMALLYGLVVLGVAETAFGYYLSCNPDWFPFGTTERLQLHYAPRWVGTYGSPNNYACLLVMATGAALALGCFSKLAWPVRIVLIYLAIMMIVGVVYSGSRGGWIALLAAIIALATMGIRNGTMRWWIPVTGAALLIAVSAFLFSFSPIAQERLNVAKTQVTAGELNSDMRVQLAADALRIAHDHLLWGTGPATFTFVHPHYQSSTFAFKAELTHDDYLNCLDDYGLVGFGLALFFVAVVTLKFFRPLAIDSRWQDRVLVATGFAAWMALVVHSLLDFNLHIPANALLLFALTGLALGRVRDEKAIHWSTFSLMPMGGWLGGTVMVLSLLFAVLVARTELGDRAYEQTLAREDVVPISDSIDGAEQALGYDSGNVQALVFLGDLYRYDASLQKEDERRLSDGLKALEAYQKALQANVLDDSVQAKMGMALDLMQKYPEASTHYQAAVAAQPYNGQFWFWLGNHDAKAGLTDQAEKAYAKSERCPFGGEGSAEAAEQLRALSGKDGEHPAVPANEIVAPNFAAPVSAH